MKTPFPLGHGGSSAPPPREPELEAWTSSATFAQILGLAVAAFVVGLIVAALYS